MLWGLVLMLFLKGEVLRVFLLARGLSGIVLFAMVKAPFEFIPSFAYESTSAEKRWYVF